MGWHLLAVGISLLFSASAQPGGKAAPEAVPVPPAVLPIDPTRGDVATEKPPLVASVCRYVGQVERDAAGREFLRLKITLEFRTSEANAVVPLGFKGLRFSAAKLDGETPTWANGANGASGANERDRLALRVPEAKTHTFLLETILPVTFSGAERRVTIEQTPAAAITSLDIMTLEPVQRASVKGAGAIGVSSQPENRSRLSAEALGVLSEFELSWQPSARVDLGAPPRVVATGDVRVHADLSSVHTEARVKVEARRGLTAALGFRLPPEASPVDVIHLERAEDVRGDEAPWTFDKNNHSLTIRLDQPLTAAGTPLYLLLRWRQPAAKPGAAVGIGRLELVQPESAGQTGVIGVWPAPGVRVQIQHSLLTTNPQDLPIPEQRTAAYAFRYWQQPVKLDLTLDAAPLAPLVAEVRGAHGLRQVGATIHLVSDFEVTPKTGAVVQELDVRWPAGFSIDRRIVLTTLVEALDPIEGGFRLRLASKQQERFTFRLEGTLPLPATPPLTLDLPALAKAAAERAGKLEPVRFIPRAGELSLVAGDVDWWLQDGTLGLRRDGQHFPELDAPLRGSSTFQLDPATESHRLNLGWQSRRPEVDSRLRAYITRRELQIEQTLHIRVPAPTPTQLWLRVPRVAEKSLRAQLRFLRPDGTEAVTDTQFGDRVRQSDTTMAERALSLPGDCPAEFDLVLEHRESRAAGNGTTRLAIPLVAPSPGEMSDRGVTAALWSAATTRVETPAGASGWQPILPPDGWRTATLALRASNHEAPLELVTHSTDADQPEVETERCLVEVRPEPEGRLDYRFSIWLERIRGEHLTVTLPGTGRHLLVRHVRLFGQDIPVENLELLPRAEDAEHTQVHIPLEPRALSRSGPLEIQFRLQVPALRWLGTGLELPAPVLEGTTGAGVTRWRVEPPRGRLALCYGTDVQPEQTWGWQLGLHPPRPRTIASEMRSWLGEPLLPFGDAPERPAAGFTQFGGVRALEVVFLSPQVWFLLCSFIVLLAGFVLYAYPPRRVGWLAALGLAGLLLLGFLRPNVLVAVLYGAQPGIVVLVGVLGLMWLWRRRWRRQVVLMPGFRRVAAGSSLIRSSARVPRAPSTHDAAPQPTSPAAERPA